MTTKTIKLLVPQDFKLDPWLTNAKPEEVAIILDLASRFPRILENEKSEMTSKLDAARNDATGIAIKKVFEESLQRAEFNVKEQIQNLQKQLDRVTMEKDTLKNINEKQEDSLREKETQLRSVEIERNDHMRRLLEQKHEFDQEKLGNKDQYNDLYKEYIVIKTNFENLKQDTESKISAARRDEKDQLNETISQLRTELFESYTDKHKETEHLHKKNMEQTEEISKLNQKINNLQQPMSRGNTGEFDVAETLREIGFNVEDTSEGQKKEEGYLDLLVTNSTVLENNRIAIEIKNKQTIRKASEEKVKKKQKDIDDDIKTFLEQQALPSWYGHV